jgi:FAD/FMN-containing dehydrogenase
MDQRARAAYAEGAGIYRIIPAAVAIPATDEDLRLLLAWARRQPVPIVPRGAGSAMGGGNVGPGVVIDLTGFGADRLELMPDRLLALTGAGLAYSGLNAAAGRYSLRLPPDPSSGWWATLGAMVATNAAGARSVRYGSVRPWVRGLELMTADGAHGWIRRGAATVAEPGLPAVDRFQQHVAPVIQAAAPLVRQRFPHTRKNSAGYALDAYLESGDLVDLIIGSEGTLGVITSIEWQLDAMPAHHAGAGIVLRDLASLADLVLAIRQYQPSALELLDQTFLDLVRSESGHGTAADWVPPSAAGLLLVEFERDNPASLRGALGDAIRAVDHLAADVRTALTEAETAELWALRHAASPILAGLPDHRRSLQVIEDGCVPVAELGRYVSAVRRAATARGLEVVLFGHAGDGHLHANLLVDVSREGWEEAVGSLLEEVTAEVIGLGGTPAGEHGAGRLRAGLLGRLYGPEVLTLFRSIKQAFDPDGILNPGVLVPGSADAMPMDHLKVGARAVALPDDIAQALRSIEREAAYQRPRLSLADRSPTP